jgi:hypothetical protein
MWKMDLLYQSIKCDGYSMQLFVLWPK